MAHLKQDLGARGRVKADIDLHIAATAIEEGATLVTSDGALLAGDIEGLVAEKLDLAPREALPVRGDPRIDHF